MAGQSNMAGRGMLEAEDSIPSSRIFTINKEGQLIPALEPLHFYEPKLAGLDCGLSFGKELLTLIPDSIRIILIPTAVGGSSIQQWIGDSVFRNVQLFSNFREKMELAQKLGTVKALLWHQGESDATDERIPLHKERLGTLIGKFRELAQQPQLPVLIGELGSFSKNNANWQAINQQLRAYIDSDPNARLIPTGDFEHKGDFIHFNSAGQREMGRRFARQFAAIQLK
jgi:hypothetical protein